MPIKFIEMSYADIDTVASISVSSGSTIRDKMRDRRSFTQWASSGSNDTIVETIEIDLGSLKNIDYIQLLNFNWKQFTIKYDLAGIPTNFSVPINETVNAETDSLIYNNFTLVNTQKIYITITSTIIANQEKTLGEIIVSNVLGAFVGYPDTNIKINKNKIIKKMLRGKIKVVDRDETISYSLGFKAYPQESDMALIETLWVRRNPFYILISGDSETDFTYLRRGWRNQDIRLVAVSKDYDPNYHKNLYFSGVEFNFDLDEV